MTSDGTNWVAKSLTLANTGTGTAVNNMQPSLVLNYCIAVIGYMPARAGDTPFAGEIQLFAFNYAPMDFLPCDGALLASANYPTLYALIGTTYGGNSTNFALPDLRGRVPINQGTGTGLSARTIGTQIGSETVTLTVPNLPAHTHTISYQ
jgi:microcystin-dependent protein